MKWMKYRLLLGVLFTSFLALILVHAHAVPLSVASSGTVHPYGSFDRDCVTGIDPGTGRAPDPEDIFQLGDAQSPAVNIMEIGCGGGGAHDIPLEVIVPGPQVVCVGELLTFNVACSDADSNETLTLAALNLPPGAVFPLVEGQNFVTGNFFWQTTQADAIYIGQTLVPQFECNTSTDNDAAIVPITVQECGG